MTWPEKSLHSSKAAAVRDLVAAYVADKQAKP